MGCGVNIDGHRYLIPYALEVIGDTNICLLRVVLCDCPALEVAHRRWERDSRALMGICATDLYGSRSEERDIRTGTSACESAAQEHEQKQQSFHYEFPLLRRTGAICSPDLFIVNVFVK